MVKCVKFIFSAGRGDCLQLLALFEPTVACQELPVHYLKKRAIFIF